MRRRALIGVLAALAGCPLAVWRISPAAAQGRRPRLAILLVAASETSPEGASRRDAPAELGWVDGRTIEIATRYAEGALDRVPALMAELVALNPDVILTHSGVAARAAAEATRMIPVVVGAASEETMVEIAGNLARPQGNVTGLTLVSREQHIKALELWKQIQPDAARIGVLVNPLSTGYQEFPAAQIGTLRSLGLDPVRAEARDQDGLAAAFAAFASARVDAVLVTADPSYNRPNMHRAINELAWAQRIGLISTFDAFTREGGLLSLSTVYEVIFRRAAIYVDKILRGAKPADLPIERPTVFKITVNLRAAKALGLDIPPSFLARADEVIE